MITRMTSTDPLVEALAIRLRRIDLISWQRIATWAEQSDSRSRIYACCSRSR
jgi:hypothetical protein